MKNVIIFLVIFLSSNYIIGQSNIGIKLFSGDFAHPATSYNGLENNSRVISAGSTINYERTVGDKLSYMIGIELSRLKSRGFNSDIDLLDQTITLDMVGPSIDLRYWFKDTYSNGFFIDAGISVPIVIDAKEELGFGDSRFITNSVTYDYKDNTQSTFPYLRIGVGGQLNLSQRLGVSLTVSGTAFNNVVDKINDKKKFNLNMQLSARAFYRFERLDAYK